MTFYGKGNPIKLFNQKDSNNYLIVEYLANLLDLLDSSLII